MVMTRLGDDSCGWLAWHLPSLMCRHYFIRVMMSASEVLLAESGTAASTIIITGLNSRELR
jgi:hypothetical protein